jgi:hypothetical protein
MSRFQCPDCGTRSRNGISCRRCGTTAHRQIQVCQMHGTRCLPGCRVCRILTRSQTDH